MAFPSIRSSTTSSITTNSTSHSITMPSSISVGDILFVFFAVDGAPGVTIDTAISGNNWSRFLFGVYGTTIGGHCYAKIAEISNALTLTTDASEQSSHASFAIYNYTSSLDSFANGDSTNINPPVMPDSPPNEDVLYIVCGCADGNVIASAAPADFVGLATAIGADAANGVGISTAYREHTYSGAYNPPEFTSPTEQWGAFTIGIWYTPAEEQGIGINIAYLQAGLV